MISRFHRWLLDVGARACTSTWRREWDSNPRYGFPYTRFPSVRLKPLGHPSGKRCGAGNITPRRRVTTRVGSIDPAHVAGFVHVVAAELTRTLAERRGSRELEQRLQAGAEIVALAQHEVEALPEERHEIEGGRLRHRARRDAAIRASGAHRLRDVGAGRADRLHRREPIERQAGTGDEREQQQLRAGALRP